MKLNSFTAPCTNNKREQTISSPIGTNSDPALPLLYPTSTITLPYRTQPLPLQYPTLPYCVPPHPTAPHPTPPHHTQPHPTPPHHTTPHYTTPHYTTLHHTTPHHTTPHHTIPYSTSTLTLPLPYLTLTPYPTLPYFTPTIPHPYHTLPLSYPTPTRPYAYHILPLQYFTLYTWQAFLLKGNFIQPSFVHRSGKGTFYTILKFINLLEQLTSTRIDGKHKSLVMRKPAFCICENKDTDQLLISAFVFATRIVQSLYYLGPKFLASSHFRGCTARVVSDLVENPEDRYYHNEAHISLLARKPILGVFDQPAIQQQKMVRDLNFGFRK